MSSSQRKVVKIPVWALSQDADRLVGCSLKSVSRKSKIRSGPSNLFPSHPHSHSTAPSCACLFAGITGLLLRSAALPWFPAWPWKGAGHPRPPAPSARDRSFPWHQLSATKGLELGRGQGLSLPPSLSWGKVNKSGALIFSLLSTNVRAKEEAVSSPLFTPLLLSGPSQLGSPNTCQDSSALGLQINSLTAIHCNPLAFYLFGSLCSEIRNFSF